jgi:hypothetical protein
MKAEDGSDVLSQTIPKDFYDENLEESLYDENPPT